MKYLDLLTMETIPVHEIDNIEKLILKHHELYTKLYFSSADTKYKTFINIFFTIKLC